jgi:hypothetical protein
MSRQVPFWMVSPKSLIGLIGAEYELMHKSGGTVLKKFYISAVFIVFIMLISFLSIFYAVELLTHIPIVEIIISTFLSILFVFIYILLINTFAKEKNTPTTKSFFVFSNISRVSFVLFMAFLLSKPIEIFFFKKSLDKDVEQYKQNLLSEHIIKTNEIFATDLLILQDRIQDLNKQNEIYNSAVLASEISSLRIKVDSIEMNKIQMTQFANAKIQTSGFFIFRIKQVYKKHPISWLICFAIIILYGIPVLLVFSISANAKYFELKKTYERDMIQKEYSAFSEKYSTLFQNNFGLTIHFYSKYKDPPFNTILKENHTYKPSKDFLSKYCPD